MDLELHALRAAAEPGSSIGQRPHFVVELMLLMFESLHDPIYVLFHQNSRALVSKVMQDVGHQEKETPLPAPPNYPSRHHKYHLIETIRPLIEVHWELVLNGPQIGPSMVSVWFPMETGGASEVSQTGGLLSTL